MRAAAIVYELLLGIALLFVPWTPFWMDNWLFWKVGPLRPWILSGTVRGAVSGIGAAFLLLAASQLLAAKSRHA